MTKEAILAHDAIDRCPPSGGDNEWPLTIFLAVVGTPFALVVFAAITYAFDIALSGMMWGFMQKYVVPISYPDCQIFTSIPLCIWMARGWARLAT
jgi:hypothetical protein